jgi:DNA-directed RNA polymerase omega subunit
MEDYSMEQLLKRVSSIYKLSNLAAARAMELSGGMKKLVESTPTEKITTTAIREIMHGKIKLKEKK